MAAPNNGEAMKPIQSILWTPLAWPFLAGAIILNGAMVAPAQPPVDDESQTLTVVADDPNASETEYPPPALPDWGSFTIHRTGNASEPLTVFFTVGGTADNGVDYERLPESVTIPAGASFVDFAVKPIADTEAEGPETVVLTLTPDGAYKLGSPTNATVTIADDDEPPPVVTVQATDADASEDATEPGMFQITRSHGWSRSFTVYFSLSGTAADGSDYGRFDEDPPGYPSVTFQPGMTQTNLVVTPLDDTLFEGAESVTLTLVGDPHPVTYYVVGTPGSATITIADDDQQRVFVHATDAEAAETGPDTGTFTITRAGLNTAPVTVYYRMSGTALNGVDYEWLPGAVVIPAGASSADVTLTPVDDSFAEGPQFAVLTLREGADYIFNGSPAAVITIEDNEPTPPVTVTATYDHATESGTAWGWFTFARTGDTANPMTVHFRLSGTATPGVDYRARDGDVPDSIVIPAGAWEAVLMIVAVDDTEVEGDETVVLTLDLTGDSAVVTIHGNAAPPPTIAIAKAGSDMQVTWAGTPGATYRVAGKNSLTDAHWNDLSPLITATTTLASWTDTADGRSTQRYYIVYRVD